MRNTLLASEFVGAGRIGRPPWLWAVAVLAISALFALPLVTMLAGSFREPGPVPRSFEFLPSPLSLQAYRDAFSLAPMLRSVANSLVVAAMFVPVAVATASMAAWSIHGMRRRRVATGIVLALFMAPTGLLWLTRFIVFDQLQLVGTWVPLIAPALLGGTPFAVLLYLLAFRRVPLELIDAARLDLGSSWQVFRRVALPLVRGTTMAVAMLAFLASWGAFLEPLLVLHRESTYTAPLALRYLEQLGRINHPVLLAGAVTVVVPALIVFAVAQKRLFTQGGLRWYAGS